MSFSDRETIDKALEFIREWGGEDGAHHKQWVLDQLVRILTESPDEYEQWVKRYEHDGDHALIIYEWDEGIAP